MPNTSLVRSNAAAVRSVGGLAVMTKGVEYALTAAGATVVLIAIIQSGRILLSWL